jgi:nucleotide-binding universal stress UspA family protein
MSIRKILAPVDGSERSRTALRTAFQVGQIFGAHVLAMHVRVDPTQAVPFVGEGMSGAVVQELIELTEREVAARAAVAREIFDQLQLSTGVPKLSVPASVGPAAAWAESVGREEDTLVRCGRLADLIVVARPADPDSLGHVTLSRALFETGRPVLVAGLEEAESIGQRIVIAWNGGVQAARAISAALPFLAEAAWVTVIRVGHERDDATTGLPDVAEYLAWHGIMAETHPIVSRGSIGEALTDAVSASGADLVVMGGYSHSRLRELILGGVTRHMLEKTVLPLLLAH